METNSSASAADGDWALISMGFRLTDGFRSAIPKAVADGVTTPCPYQHLLPTLRLCHPQKYGLCERSINCYNYYLHLLLTSRATANY